MKKLIFLVSLFIFFMMFSQKRMIKKGAIGEFSSFFGYQRGTAQRGTPYVNAGDDVVINCGQECIDITADFLEIGETDTYAVTSIPFNPPFPFHGLSNPLNLDIDDSWSTVETLPFEFCFFGDIETEFQIGSNGAIRFDVDTNDVGMDSNGWSFSQNIPNNLEEALSEANIFTPVHDLDPTKNSFVEIAWEIIGTAPNRALAVSFYNVPMYECDSKLATHMAVFYETTNVIDIYIKSKPSCYWNENRAVVGIQNNEGTKAFFPPGRNTKNSPWTAYDEAWRFTPSGTSIIDFAWLDEEGEVVAATPTLNVCPSQQTTYTARVIYTLCNGKTVTLTDNVTVDIMADASPIFDLEESYTLCITTNGTEVSGLAILDTGLSTANYTFDWFFEGILIADETKAQLEASTSGSYTVTVTNTSTGCSSAKTTDVIESGVPMLMAEVTTKMFSDSHNIEATATGFGDYEYSLNGGTWQESGIFSGVASGAHTITARDIKGCGLATATVIVVNYPHYFTPNNDGYNDTWNVAGLNNQPSAKVHIFDRYGKLLKQIATKDSGWDGTFNGALMPTNDYWFILEYNDPISGERREFKAHFTLKR